MSATHPFDNSGARRRGIRTNTPGASLDAWLVPGLAVYFALHVLVRASGSSVLDLDEAQQMVEAQWWLTGYAAHPPLYTWLQYLAFQVLGSGVTALSVVKNVLLFLTYAFFHLSARRLTGDGRLAALATLSLLLIPQVAWESQRDLTHSVIVTSAAAASVYVLLRWLDRPDVRNYLLLGVVFALGLLSKYNYAVFAAAVLLTLLTLPRGRALLLHPRILLSAAIATALTAPHLYWLWAHRNTGDELVPTVELGGGLWSLSGLPELAMAVIGFLTPLWLVLLIVFRRGFLSALTTRPGSASPSPFPVRRYLLIVLALLAGLVVTLEITAMKDRWLLPILLLFPIQVFAAMPPLALTPARVRTYVMICLVVPVLALLFMAARVHQWPVAEGQHRYGYPFDTLAAQLVQRGYRPGLILSDRYFIAGNLRTRLPGSQAMVPDLNPDGLQCGEGDLLVAWDTRHGTGIPDALYTWLHAELGFRPPPGRHEILHAQPAGSELGILLVPASEAVLDRDCRTVNGGSSRIHRPARPFAQARRNDELRRADSSL